MESGYWICKTCEKSLKLLDKVGYPRNHLKLNYGPCFSPGLMAAYVVGLCVGKFK